MFGHPHKLRRAARRARWAVHGPTSAEVPNPQPWSRQRIQIVVGLAAVMTVAMLAGLVIEVVHVAGDLTTRTHHHSAAATTTGDRPHGTTPPPSPVAGAGAGGQGAAQDSLAMAAMPDSAGEVTASALSTHSPGVIALPASTKQGPAGVTTGFAHTPAGAMAQMLAIDVTALQTKQLVGARQVISSWAAPHGPTPSSWDRVHVLAAIMSDGGLSDGDAGSWAFRVTPVMGLIKGAVGPDFVVPCVDYEFEATLSNGASPPPVALGGCARMQWVGDRWTVAAGSDGNQTAPGSSAWPDTDAAIKDGYQDLAGVAAALAVP